MLGSKFAREFGALFLRLSAPPSYCSKASRRFESPLAIGPSLEENIKALSDPGGESFARAAEADSISITGRRYFFCGQRFRSGEDVSSVGAGL